MGLLKKSVGCCFALALLCACASMLSAQDASSAKTGCFLIRVQLNGKPLGSPPDIVVKTKTGESTIRLEDGCFPIPPDKLKDIPAADVQFNISDNQVTLGDVAAPLFAGPWDVELEDKRSGGGAFSSLPKDAKVQEACAVTFHVGEPEILETQPHCRKPLAPSKPASSREPAQPDSY